MRDNDRLFLLLFDRVRIFYSFLLDSSSNIIDEILYIKLF